MKSRMLHLMFICLALLTAPSLYAVPISYSLGDLIDSTGFVVGDKWFHDFWGNITTFPRNPDGTNCPQCILTPTSLDAISITPMSFGPGLYGMAITGGLLAYNPNGVASIDIALKYRVDVLNQEAYRDLYITDYHLEMGGYMTLPELGGAAFITVAENFQDGNRHPIGNILTFYDGPGGVADRTADSIVFNTPQKSLFVVKDINLTVLDAFAIVSVIDQYASQNGAPPPVPEPTTVSILGLGLVAMGVSLRRKLF
jgi:hypothetical protein